ncbi:GTPase IMAP family member 9-like [Lepisosteus oculatus]|uniref:GTPase IMAP family member 9-like n=1 Tax=Lepisosteus oculatus TaxID=7918 RepID=UPI0035F514F9
MENTHLRVVLLGRRGTGKSSAGNTLLGRTEFPSVLSSTAVTTRCGSAHAAGAGGRRLHVVDTPDLFDEGLPDRQAHIRDCLALSAPGPHAFLLVLQLGRFTEGEKRIGGQMKQAFGPGVTRHAVVLFTYGDDLGGAPVEDFLRGAQAELKALLEACGNRYHVFNNRDAGDHRQVSQLLDKIEGLVRENGGAYYTQRTGPGRREEDPAADGRPLIEEENPGEPGRGGPPSRDPEEGSNPIWKFFRRCVTCLRSFRRRKCPGRRRQQGLNLLCWKN